MDLEFFYRILSMDSTSGKEGDLADQLAMEFSAPGRVVETFDVGNGTRNLLVSWGVPKVVFCTHLDTVPPYIAPSFFLENSDLTSLLSQNQHVAGTSNPTVLPSQNESVNTAVLTPQSQHVAGTSNPAVLPSQSQHVTGTPDTTSQPSQSQAGISDICGRGTCDAKGQIFSMYEACKILEAKGCRDFGLLLLAGEETGSEGAKAFREMHPGAEWLIVGEPTDNHMASASKGTKAFEVTFAGEACHSGYPENGSSAIEHFNDFMNALRSIRFPYDGILGETTWNIGKLSSDNPQNVLSDRLTCRVYFRTTFESDEMVCNVMKNMAGADARLRFGRPQVQDGSDLVAKNVAQWQKAMMVVPLGGDSPTKYDVLEGFPVKPVSFGSDAPQLTNFRRKILCGPGSILVAHRPEEHILVRDLEQAVCNYVRMYEIITEAVQDGSAGCAGTKTNEEADKQ